MIPYHGGPITPIAAAVKIWSGRHGLISFARPDQIELAAEVCQSVVIDNSAFTLWTSKQTPDWPGYYRFVERWMRHPAFDWALIPDVIDGAEPDNDALIAEWPHGIFGVPVWHMHESMERLQALCQSWPRVAIGSSGQWATPGTKAWWVRIEEAMEWACDSDGLPLTKLHGLRQLNPEIYTRVPYASVDSSSITRNIGLDNEWKGTYQPRSKAVRGLVLADRFEAFQSPAVWKGYKK